MVNQITVVINAFNEEKNIERAIESVKWADEVLVCDMHSADKTVEIAKKMGAKVIFHKQEGYVEPARNFAISKASHDWILILDADEEIPATLAERLKEFVAKPLSSDFVEMPRKNIIFNKWMKASMWWPDYQIRLFKRGSVVWQNQIHSKPQTKGVGLTLEADEKWAIIHYNYQTISQFLKRMDRYTKIQSEELRDAGYKFSWKDLLEKPVSEFLSRFFANEGYKDGLHGLSLSLLQAFSFLILYLKLWEMKNFTAEEVSVSQFEQEAKVMRESTKYWINEKRTRGAFGKFLKIFKK